MSQRVIDGRDALPTVQVDGDGRLVPATQDEIMVVEDLLEDDKCEPKLVPDTRQTTESCKTEGCLMERNPFQAPEGLELDVKLSIFL